MGTSGSEGDTHIVLVIVLVDEYKLVVLVTVTPLRRIGGAPATSMNIRKNGIKPHISRV